MYRKKTTQEKLQNESAAVREKPVQEHLNAPDRIEALAHRLMSRLKFRDVNFLLAVHDLLSVRAAATQLGWSQPAANKRLLEIENAFGAQLYLRTKTALKPTPEASAVYRTCLQWKATAQALAHNVQNLQQGDGASIVLGVGRSHYTPRLVELLKRLAEQVPKLEIAVRLGSSLDIAQGLLNNTLHLGIGLTTSPRDTWLTAYRMPAVTYQVIASPEVAAATKDSGQDHTSLARYRWLTMARGEASRNALHKLLPGGTDSGLIELDSLYTAVLFMAGTPSLTLLPADMAHWAVNTHKLVPLPVTIDLTFDGFCIARHTLRPLCTAGEMLVAALSFVSSDLGIEPSQSKPSIGGVP